MIPVKLIFQNSCTYQKAGQPGNTITAEDAICHHRLYLQENQKERIKEAMGFLNPTFLTTLI